MVRGIWEHINVLRRKLCSSIRLVFAGVRRWRKCAFFFAKKQKQAEIVAEDKASAR